MQNLTNTLENIIKLDEGDQKSFELALFSKNIMDMERGPEVLLITAILTEEHNSKPRHSVVFSGVCFWKKQCIKWALVLFAKNSKS